MRDCLTPEERRVVRHLEERQHQLAHLADTELVRTLLGQEVEKIKAAARRRAGARWYGVGLTA